MAPLAPSEQTGGRTTETRLVSVGPASRRVPSGLISRDEGRGLRMSDRIERPDGFSSQPRVLLVEDDQANRRRIREILINEGIDVVGEASNGSAGIELTARLE